MCFEESHNLSTCDLECVTLLVFLLIIDCILIFKGIIIDANKADLKQIKCHFRNPRLANQTGFVPQVGIV
jgi:hypothetical protein